MRPANFIGFSPKREVQVDTQTGNYFIKVTPPAIIGGKTQTIELTPKQYIGYLKWQEGQLIQDALPDLTPSQREIILTGLDDDTFNRFCGG